MMIARAWTFGPPSISTVYRCPSHANRVAPFAEPSLHVLSLLASGLQSNGRIGPGREQFFFSGDAVLHSPNRGARGGESQKQAATIRELFCLGRSLARGGDESAHCAIGQPID